MKKESSLPGVVANVVNNTPFYKRLWNLISNPFYYVIKGNIRY